MTSQQNGIQMKNVLKTALWKTSEGQDPLAMENLLALQVGVVATPPEN